MGALASRNQGFKHLNKVGYIGYEQRPIPRWASDPEQVKKILKYQNQQPNLATAIFGKVTKALAAELNVQKLLGEYDGMKRGSSQVWEDDSDLKPHPQLAVPEQVQVSDFATIK